MESTTAATSASSNAPENLQSLWMSFLVILVSEIGDKTFLISAVMAMTHSRLLIFSAAISALAFMTVLSAALGHIVPNLISKQYTQFAAGCLFLIFGLKMLYDGYKMTGKEGQEELDEVTQELLSKEDADKAKEMEQGGEKSEKTTSSVFGRFADGCSNVANYFLSPVFIQTFVLTFLAEWGDRSQIATIALAGAEDFWWVTIGSLLGHSICSGVAVLGGRLLAAKISVKTDVATREAAQSHLEALARESFPQYMGMLCQELANEQNLPDTRQSAGIAFKNALTAKDSALLEEYVNRWLQIDPLLRHQIKEGLLATLASPVASSGFAAAQAIAAVATIELPRRQWDNMISLLLDNVTKFDSNNLKESTLQAIGFICETIDPDVLAEQANLILTAVAQGARKEEPNQRIRLAAIKALTNSLDFVKNNFENEGERNYIMQIVCEATTSPDEDVQVASFECLVKIVQLYYDKMPFYMEQALCGLTIEGMSNENEKVALQSVEFWSTVCEEEYNIIQDNLHAMENNESPPHVCYKFAEQVAPKLVAVLLYLLTKKDEDSDEDEWNISMAAATCLSLLSNVITDHIVPHVLPWIETHIQSTDWHYREAAVMAFGSILDGPNKTLLAPLVDQALPALFGLMKDSNVQVKDTTAWTLGRICEYLSTNIKAENLPGLITVVIEGLGDASRVAANCAWCIINLAEGISRELPDDPPTFVLSPCFDALIHALLSSVEDKPHHDANMKATVYEAVATLVSTCAKDCFPTVEKLAGIMMTKLNGTLTMQREIVNADDRSALQELQANICSVLTNIIRRMGPAVAPIADQTMMTLLTILNSSSRTSIVHEDAFIVISALSSAVEGDFIRYMKDFNPHLIRALQNPQDHQLSAIAVGLIGDICRALNEQVLPFCSDYMNCLLQNLQSPILDRNVKPSILSCFGDIAIAVGGSFDSSVELVMTILDQAMANAKLSPDASYDQIDYVSALREGIIEAYVGITQGLAAGQKVQVLTPYIPRMFMFMAEIAVEVDGGHSLTSTMAGLLGDIADAFPEGSLKPQYSASWIDRLLKGLKASASYNPKAQELAKWARSRVRKQLI
ncbi:karyopherin beta [Chytridiales sp. JEL 0842]|nr:karyopherin beta [Chytridiales sp. JEL 0842]